MTTPVTRRVVTLLTDFGLEDGYVGAMKGVLLSQAPEVTIVDLSHQIPPQDVLRGGLVWASAVPYFPPGTIHVAVVDPGVGSRRRILAVEARGSFFVAPDNGILGLVLKRREMRRVVNVTRGARFLEPISSTFHGRDILAPAAAHLACGGALSALGNAVRRYRWLTSPRPRTTRQSRGGIRTEGGVLYADRYGNAITNLSPPDGTVLQELRCEGWSFGVLERSYAAVRPGRALALVGSGGLVEVAVRDGSAAEQLGLAAGTPVVALWRRARPRAQTGRSRSRSDVKGS